MSYLFKELISINDNKNYIIPFLWIAGEKDSIIKEEIKKIYESGINEFCIESRIHPDFLGSQWWENMDLIINEAKKYGMKIWILDDQKFPTGFAAGKVKNAPLGLKRLFLKEKHIDVIGPLKDVSIIIRSKGFDPWFEKDDNILTIIGIERDPITGNLTNNIVDLSRNFIDDCIIWDIPEGIWRIFIIIETHNGGSKEHLDFINFIDEESVDILVKSVYEEFYKRYKDEFGTTIVGFFSDEPGFYNNKKVYDFFNSKLGIPDLDLPWSKKILDILNKEFGREFKLYLPYLWYDTNDEASKKVRYTYMNVVTNLYSVNFSQRLGNWCRAHNVNYIGHIIEDNGVHSRLGCGTGHYFRAIKGQDMAGIDVVLRQIIPGFDQIAFNNVLFGAIDGADGEFYHFGLAKLASSMAHLEPMKKGKAICEIFGAYGWSEGLRLMKWLVDHMLVRGINYFVPHAFSPKEFPDPDCPPHFYARGKNPQFKYFKILTQYMNRLCHLFNNGNHIANCAVLYHAESEWYGDCMYYHKVVKELMQNKIDCDIVWCDLLLEHGKIYDKKLFLNGEYFDCLIVPYCEALPYDLIMLLYRMNKEGLCIIFIDQMVKSSCEAKPIDSVVDKIENSSNVYVVKLYTLVSLLEELGFYEIMCNKREQYLRYYHYKHKDIDLYMFFNEHPYKNISNTLHIRNNGYIYSYDAFNNKIFEWSYDEAKKQDNTIINLTLEPYESLLILISKEKLDENLLSKRKYKVNNQIIIPDEWIVSISSADEYPKFSVFNTMRELTNINKYLPNFSGTIKYETDFNYYNVKGNELLQLEKVFEIAQVYLNGKDCGARICQPYIYEIGSYLKEGKNNLVIEVTNTLVNQQKDPLSRFSPIEPSGLIGHVKILF